MDSYLEDTIVSLQGFPAIFRAKKFFRGNEMLDTISLYTV